MACEARHWNSSDYLLGILFLAIPLLKLGGELMFAVIAVLGCYRCWVDRQSLLDLPVLIKLLAVCMASFALLKLFSGIWAVQPSLAVRSFFSHLHFLCLLPLIMVFRTAEQPLKSMLYGMQIALVALGIWAAVRWSLAEHTKIPTFRAGAQNSGVLGDICAIYFIFVSVDLFLHRAKDLWQHAKLPLFSLICGVIALTATGARTALMSLTVTGLLLSALLAWQLPKAKRLSVLAAMATVIAVITTSVAVANWDRILLGHQQWLDHYSGKPLIAGEENSVGARLALYKTAWMALTAEPIRMALGYGAGSTRLITQDFGSPVLAQKSLGHFHNQYLQLMTESGILGLIAPLGVIAAIILLAKVGTKWNVKILLFAISFISYELFAGLTNNVTKHGLLHTMLVSITAVLSAQALLSLRNTTQIRRQ